MSLVLTVFHVLICIFLIIVVLMQSGRGGGLTEGFASAEAMFGGRTNELMIKITSVLCALFFVTSLGLAYLSARQERSLMASEKVLDVDKIPKIELELGTEEPEVPSDKAAPSEEKIPEASQQKSSPTP